MVNAERDEKPVGVAVLGLGNVGSEVVRIIEESADDLAARIGGEEFALLLVAASVEQARAVAVKVQKELDRVPWPQIAERLVVTVSAGIACSAEALVGASSETNAGDCADALLAAADRRLYAAKAAGRNRVVMSD